MGLGASLVLLVLSGLPALANGPVRVSLWAAEVPMAKVSGWQDRDGGEWFAAAQAEVAAGRAEQAAVLMLSGRLGEKMTIESLREEIYPTEYDPGDGLGSVGQTSLEELMAQPWPLRPPFLLPPHFFVAFETRNVGEVIEVETTRDTDAGIHGLRLAAEWIRREGEDVYLKYGQDDGGTWKIAYPRFASRRIHASLDCPAGKWMLIGMVDPWRAEAKPGTKALVFVRVESIGRGQ